MPPPGLTWIDALERADCATSENVYAHRAATLVNRCRNIHSNAPPSSRRRDAPVGRHRDAWTACLSRSRAGAICRGSARPRSPTKRCSSTPAISFAPSGIGRRRRARLSEPCDRLDRQRRPRLCGQSAWSSVDTVLRLDRALGAFLDDLDRTVGKDRYAIAISADHGVADPPEEHCIHRDHPAPRSRRCSTGSRNRRRPSKGDDASFAGRDHRRAAEGVRSSVRSDTAERLAPCRSPGDWKAQLMTALDLPRDGFQNFPLSEQQASANSTRPRYGIFVPDSNRRMIFDYAALGPRIALCLRPLVPRHLLRRRRAASRAYPRRYAPSTLRQRWPRWPVFGRVFRRASRTCALEVMPATVHSPLDR